MAAEEHAAFQRRYLWVLAEREQTLAMQLRDSEAKAQAAEAKLRTALGQIELLAGSRSWRWSTPLRGAAAWLRRTARS